MQNSRVKLEPELEAIAGDWPPAKRLEMARKLARWSRQLRITGLIILADAAPSPRPRTVPCLPARKARLN
jgi:hypothetical protein